MQDSDKKINCSKRGITVAPNQMCDRYEQRKSKVKLKVMCQHCTFYTKPTKEKDKPNNTPSFQKGLS